MHLYLIHETKENYFLVSNSTINIYISIVTYKFNEKMKKNTKGFVSFTYF